VVSGDLPYLFFVIFISLIWVSLFMVPNSSPRASGGVKTPFQRFFFKGQFLLIWSFLFPSGCARERAGCSPRAFWRNGVIPSKAFTPECCSREYPKDRLRVLYTQCLFPLCGEAPSPFPHKGRSGSFPSCHYVPHSSFRSEEGWVTPHYPRWASIDVLRELQAGKSKRMPEAHSIGVGWWPYGRISKYPRAVMVDVGTVR